MKKKGIYNRKEVETIKKENKKMMKRKCEDF